MLEILFFPDNVERTIHHLSMDAAYVECNEPKAHQHDAHHEQYEQGKKGCA